MTDRVRINPDGINGAHDLDEREKVRALFRVRRFWRATKDIDAEFSDSVQEALDFIWDNDWIRRKEIDEEIIGAVHAVIASASPDEESGGTLVDPSAFDLLVKIGATLKQSQRLRGIE